MNLLLKEKKNKEIREKKIFIVHPESHRGKLIAYYSKFYTVDFL